MKFNHSLQFNAVPDWISKYIDYAGLKKLIYQLEKQQLELEQRQGETESEALIETDADAIFARAINAEVQKVDSFYAETEARLYKQLDDLLSDERGYELQRANALDDLALLNGLNHEPQRYYDDDRPRRRSSSSGELPQRRQRSNSEGAFSLLRHSTDAYEDISDYEITLKRRAIQIYVSLSELKSFAELNQTGFTKALKKYRKTLNSDLAERFLAVPKAYAFTLSTQHTLDRRIEEAVEFYAKVATGGNLKDANQQLRLHLREHVVWERNTVWRDMIGMERRTQAVVPQKGAAGVAGGATVVTEQPEYLRIGKYQVPAWLFSGTCLKLLGIFIIFLSLVSFPVFESLAQSHCLSVVVTASLLWATEAMPLFVTSLLIPFLIVTLRIPLDGDGTRMSSEEASKFIFSTMWSSVIMLLLGGFTLAAALSKYDLAKRLATAILSRSGTNPRIVLLNLMFVAAFLSMWISNVAAPVLCYSIAQSLLRTLPDGSEFAKAIVFGIALASNVGGMMSPIASPQNIIALENMHPQPSWGQWFLVAIPVSLVSLLLIWILLVMSFPMSRQTTTVGHVHPISDKLTGTQWFIIATTTVTIVLWIFSHQLEGSLGEMGVSALIPIVLFFGTGVLTAEDFNNFLWTIIALAMGGIALGKAVSSSGLLHTIAATITHGVEGMGTYQVLLIFGFLMLVVATFVSHTVAALIILPLVESVGKNLPNPRPELFVMASALLASGAMGLPTSGFPNVTAICMTDNLGNTYLTVGTFIKRGVLASFLVYFVVITIGYFFMTLAGF
ncbi:low-affinity phosphate transporter Pho91p [Trichomonascus vanleenenianus]|uniref:Pho91p n=1 Tax=Trichomonascus vanleenenianus TaxID=2268995 RepID=UPI003ECA5BE4